MSDKKILDGLAADAHRVMERILVAAKDDKISEAIESLKVFIENHHLSQANVAAKLGVSTAVINQFLQNKYQGKTDDLINKVINLINTFGRRERKVRNISHVDTSAAKKIEVLITATEAFSSENEGKLGIIIADSGQGKTNCLKQYAEVNKNTVYLELDSGMTSTLLFAEIAEKLNVNSSGSLATITRRLINYLQNRHIIIMLDEASGLKVGQLNLLRQIILIKSRCPLILAGNRDLLHTIMENREVTLRGHQSLDQLTSRLMQILDLDSEASNKDGGIYTAEDIRKLYEYGDIKLTRGAVGSLQKICRTPKSGRMHICECVISALHVSPEVLETNQITAENIVKAICDLRLPVKTRLPLAALGEEEIEEEKQAVAKAG